jgi:hypothetical protein
MNSVKQDNLYDAYSKFIKSGETPEKGNVLAQVKTKVKRPNPKEIEKQKSQYRLGMLKTE